LFHGGYVAVLPALVMAYFGGRNVSSIIGGVTPAWRSTP
jgi:hypothetical protein